MNIEAIEHAAAIPWPASSRAMLGEWCLSASDGFSRRRNSAVPAGPVPDDLNGRMNDVAAWYIDRGLPVLYRTTPLCDPKVDSVLEERGFSVEDSVLVMTRSLSEGDRVDDVDASPIVTDDWITTELDALGIDRVLVDPCLHVRPDQQRRCHARRMLSDLHSFGHREGAEHAYLQVVECNDAAVKLYRSMGYEVSHRYWYRRAGLEGS
jgi:GNAT superfamily N-acetyltransferase